jgi:ABC-type uncharacterized transport system ATPase component
MFDGGERQIIICTVVVVSSETIILVQYHQAAIKTGMSKHA